MVEGTETVTLVLRTIAQTVLTDMAFLVLERFPCTGERNPNCAFLGNFYLQIEITGRNRFRSDKKKKSFNKQSKSTFF